MIALPMNANVIFFWNGFFINWKTRKLRNLFGMQDYGKTVERCPDTIAFLKSEMLGVFLGLGGMVGIYLGARCRKFVPSKAIKWMLASIILFTGIKYMTDFLGH